MIESPYPGTLAYQTPEPSVVAAVRQLVSEGVKRSEAVARLSTIELERKDVEAAQTYWLGQMHQFAWDDYTGTRVLMILEDVLRAIPRDN